MPKKAIRVSKKIWKKLMQKKIKEDKKSVNEVIKQLLEKQE